MPEYRARGPFQRIVEELMRTLLEDCPGLLEERELAELTGAGYCRRALELRIANLQLVRHRGRDHMVRSQGRYWVRAFAGRFQVCSQWWRGHHRSNARALARYASRLATKNPGHPDVPSLRPHVEALEDLARTGDARFRDTVEQRATTPARPNTAES